MLRSQRSLDERFSDMRPSERFKQPVRGWIKAIREALGMTTAQLARRLGVAQPSIIDIERSEVKGTIQLATLRRVAEAMNCKLVYALVPNEPLEDMVHERARRIAARRLKSVEHTMRLEDQVVRRKDLEAQIEAIASTLKPNVLWDET
jgi:predicted DNA-binding mobile mystery protein A